MRQWDGGLGPLENVLGYQLKVAEAALRSAMEERLRPLGLSVPQYAVLELLAQRPGVSVAQLARSAFVTRQAMHGVLQGLERRGLVSRGAAAGGRALPAHLTELGAQLRNDASREVSEVEDRLAAALARDEQAQVTDALRRIALALERGVADGRDGAGG